MTGTKKIQGNLFSLDTRRPATIYVGFDWNEQHRLEAIRREKSNWLIEAPMVDEPVWDKCQMERAARALGMPIPKLYRLGFPHNNCGGRCVRAGISHFVHLYRVLPERFLEWEREEQIARRELESRGIVPFSILKDRRGGSTRVRSSPMMIGSDADVGALRWRFQRSQFSISEKRAGGAFCLSLSQTLSQKPRPPPPVLSLGLSEGLSI